MSDEKRPEDMAAEIARLNVELFRSTERVSQLEKLNSVYVNALESAAKALCKLSLCRDCNNRMESVVKETCDAFLTATARQDYVDVPLTTENLVGIANSINERTAQDDKGPECPKCEAWTFGLGHCACGWKSSNATKEPL